MAQERASRRLQVDGEDIELRRRNVTFNEPEPDILQDDETEWDVFLNDPIKNESGSVANQEFMQKVSVYLKYLAALITFFVILIGSVISKGTLLFMTSQLNPSQIIPYCNQELDKEKQYIVKELSKTEKVPWIWCIIISFSVPEVIAFIKSWISFWKNRHKLQKKNDDEESGNKNDDNDENNDSKKDETETFSYLNWFFVSGVETCYVIGLALLIFYIFPNLDVVKCVMLTNCVCFIPSVLNLRSTLKNSSEETTTMKLAKICLDVLAILLQLSSFVVWPLVEGKLKLWAIPIALFLISMHYWENFIDAWEGVIFLDNLKNIKHNVDAIRYTYYKYVSLWKIICFLLLAMLINNYNDVPVETLFELKAGFGVHDINITEVKPLEFSNIRDFSQLIPTGSVIQLEAWESTPVYVLLINIFITLVTKIFGIFACKIRIQPFSYALPINLTVPVTITLLLALCGMRNNDPCVFHGIIPPYLFFASPLVYNLKDYIINNYMWVWILWLFSQTWITFHIWTNSRQRMSKAEKLYVLPVYDALLIDQSLSLNRRWIELNEQKPSISKDNMLTRIFVCATMWHETRDEMMEFLKSIFRMDEDQSARRLAKDKFGTDDPDYYEFETHIYFDDAFQYEKLPKELKEKRQPRRILNDYVKLMMDSMNEAAKEIHLTEVKMEPPQILPTHYGGRLVYTLPGKTKMIVHLKDKEKIRHKKRWSQVMYMYYLLGYKLVGDRDIGGVDDMQMRAENTFLLALDGDIDFQPNAVSLLVDLMKNNEDLGAACGRIHPIGSGPMVWYQMFEYAIGHWLQKATEDIIGCVLCSPGCFSLFRAEALMGNNVMKKYTTVSQEARHYVQYDQGEDRWLCTLMLQTGFSVKYCSASDAYTHCPEGFNEFYNQRRRWVPSTMANIMDLLMDSSRTVEKNRNISYFYICYQYLLMAGTILGPGTIFLMLVGAFVAAFPIDNWTSFFYNLVPILLFMFICYTCKQKIQLFAAGIISAAYGLIMMAVLVGIVLQIKNDGVLAPSSLFLFLVAGSMIVTAFLHPVEIKCLPCGIVYYVTVPSMYLLLIIYSIFNLNDVSWGTREVPKEVTEQESKIQEAKKNEKTANNKANNLLGFLQRGGDSAKNVEGSMEFSLAGLFKCMLCTNKKPQSEESRQLAQIAESINVLNRKMDFIERGSEVGVSRRQSVVSGNQSFNRDTFQPSSLPTVEESINDDAGSVGTISSEKQVIDGDKRKQEEDEEDKRDDLVNPHWLDDIESTCVDNYGKAGPVRMMEQIEHDFWKELIKRYLKPLEDNEEKQKKVKSDLKDLRDKCVLAFFMLNALFVLIVFLLTLKKDELYIEWPFGVKANVTFDQSLLEVQITKEYLHLEPIGFVFVIFFAIIMGVQFLAMLMHRIETLSHILAAAEFNLFTSNKVKKQPAEHGSTKNEKMLYYIKINGVSVARDWQRLKNYKEDKINTVSGRRDTIRFIAARRADEKNKEKIIYLEDAFNVKFSSFEKNPQESFLKTLPPTERRKTVKNMRRNTVVGNRNGRPNGRVISFEGIPNEPGSPA